MEAGITREEAMVAWSRVVTGSRREGDRSMSLGSHMLRSSQAAPQRRWGQYSLVLAEGRKAEDPSPSRERQDRQSAEPVLSGRALLGRVSLAWAIFTQLVGPVCSLSRCNTPVSNKGHFNSGEALGSCH